MSYLVGSSCFIDPASAATAFYAAVPAVLGPSTVTVVELQAGVWQVVTRDPAGVVSSFAAPVPAFPDCGLAGSLADIGTLAAGVMAAWVVVAAIMFIRRAL